MAKQYVYTDLSVLNSLVMTINGVSYAVVQFTASWAGNEIPTAAVMLPVGRNAQSQVVADIMSAPQHTQMVPVQVYFTPAGDYDNTGTQWPAFPEVIFDGFFTGYAYRKINGKVHVIVNLIHWSAALGFSSALTKSGHVSNPTQLNAAAVLPSLGIPNTGASAQGNNISSLVPAQLAAPNLTTDLWASMKSILCLFANSPSMPLYCTGPGTDAAVNDVALSALSRIEGPTQAPNCSLPYTVGAPLALVPAATEIAVVADAISYALGHEFIESWSTSSFWDKLVGQWLPMFQMAFLPLVDTAAIIADTPAFNGGVWKVLDGNEYDSYDMSRELHRPLKAVGVIASFDSQTIGGRTEAGEVFGAIGGCFTADASTPGDGMYQFIQSPPWLKQIFMQPNYINFTTGITSQAPSKTASTPVNPPAAENTPDAYGLLTQKLYAAYAQSVYVTNMLRGMTGVFSGKLRFDIAPLSIVMVNPTTDAFIGPGEDSLAVPIFGCVDRVTIGINAEAGMAGTTLQLSHIRTQAENAPTALRTSTPSHPLFTLKSIHGGGKHGAALIPAYDL
jgi:hypothetical protein